MSKFNLRRLQRDDITAINPIVAEAFSSTELGASVEQKMVDYCESGCHLLDINEQKSRLVPVEYWVLADGEVLVGLCGIYRLNWAWEGSFWIGWFAIAPAFQKQGLGKATVAWLSRLARGKGGEVLKVETELNGKAQGFYERLDFCPEGIISKHYGPDSNAAILSLDLNSSEARALDEHHCVEHLTPLCQGGANEVHP